MDKTILAIGVKPKGGDSDEPTFDLPKGVDFTDVKEGDEKEVIAVLRKEADGRVCIVKVNGVSLKDDVEPDDDEDDSEEMPDGPADDEAVAPPSPQTMGGAAQMAGLM